MTPRILVTGASGYLGSAIAARLARGGAEVHALWRKSAPTTALVGKSLHPLIGTLADTDPWISTLKNCDMVVFAHSADSGEDSAALDQRAIEAVRSAALDGRVRTLLYMSGCWQYGHRPGEILDENSERRPQPLVAWRTAHEQVAIDLAAHEVRTIVLQPGVVYGEHRGILGGWFREARAQHTVSYPGDGSQHWPLVHRDDVAEAAALALEHGKHGERYIVADGSRHTVREIATTAAHAADARAVALDADQVRAKLGAYGEALLGDLQLNATKAHRELGWVPRHNSFVAEAPALWREWQQAREATPA